MGLTKTLEEYIKMYEKHIKEKFQFNTGFSFFYHPEHGFCEYKIEDTGLYIWQLCGDLKYWVDIGYKVCQQFQLPAMSAYILRHPKPFIRKLGFKIVKTEHEDGYYRFACKNKSGEELVATQHGDKYIFVWKIEVKDNDNTDV